MLFIGGWHDLHLPGTLAGFRHIAAAGRVPARLVVGPWAHFPWDRKVGALDFGPDAETTIDLLQVRWFDRWLKDIPNGVEQDPAVRLFDLGTRTWRDFAAWPDRAVALYPSATGRAAVVQTDGRLLDASAAPGIEWLVHDPWRPAPSLGGAFGVPPGPAERSAVDARSDVLTFTSSPLEAPLRMAGAVEAALFLVSDAPSLDIGCVLSRVGPGGQVFAVASGYRHLRRFDSGQAVAVPMRACCITLLPGEALRLSLSAAAFPAFPVNPGTGADPTRSQVADARIIQIGLRHGGAQPSCIRVSVSGD